jgi:hypothetical protein
LAQRPKQLRHLLSRAHVTGLYRRQSQPQSLSGFTEAEAIEIPQKDDGPIFFRQQGECRPQPGNRLTPLILDRRQVAFIGD